MDTPFQCLFMLREMGKQGSEEGSGHMLQTWILVYVPSDTECEDLMFDAIARTRVCVELRQCRFEYTESGPPHMERRLLRDSADKSILNGLMDSTRLVLVI